MKQLGDALAHLVVTRALVPVLVALPLRAALALGRGLGSAAFHGLRIRRRVVMANLRYVLGPGRSERELGALAAESYRQFAMTLVELLRAPSGRDDPLRVEIPDLELLKALQKEGRGALLCSPHYGSFERMAAGAAAQGLRLCAVMRPLKSERFDALLVECRARAGVEVAQLGRTSSYALLDHLARGTMLGLLPDQNARHGIEVEFLGRPARTYRGPAVLHLRSGAPIAVCTSRRDARDPTRHRVSIRMLPDDAPDPHGGSAVHAVTQRICDAMSEEVLRAPEQYFWMHRRWGDAPLA